MDPNQLHPETLKPNPEGPTLPPTQTPNEIEETKKISKRVLLILFLILLILVPSSIFLYSKFKPAEYKSVSYQDPTPVSSPKPTPLASDSTADWRTHAETDFEISFKYPSGYGDIAVLEIPAGRILKFSGTESLLLGAYIKPDNGNGRGGSIFDFSGYSERDGKYFYKTWLSGSEEEIIPIEVLNVDSNKILILNNDSFTVSKDAYDGLGLIGDATIALINLETSKYAGIVVSNGLDDKGLISQEEFRQILSTFKFVDQTSPLPSATPTGEQVACTQEAMLCPDGYTYVSREGPNCEFAPCPGN
jgi:hypothetical protein